MKSKRTTFLTYRRTRDERDFRERLKTLLERWVAHTWHVTLQTTAIFLSSFPPRRWAVWPGQLEVLQSWKCPQSLRISWFWPIPENSDLKFFQCNCHCQIATHCTWGNRIDQCSSFQICQETAARDGLMKMKQVYESNPALGDPMSIQGQLTDNEQRLTKLQSEKKKFQVHLQYSI